MSNLTDAINKVDTLIEESRARERKAKIEANTKFFSQLLAKLILIGFGAFLMGRALNIDVLASMEFVYGFSFAITPILNSSH